MDCNKQMLPGGIIDWPVRNPSKAFLLKHADKYKIFLREFRSYAGAKKFGEGIKKLAKDFEVYGPSQTNRDRISDH